MSEEIKKLPLFIQYTLEEIQTEMPEIGEYFFDQFSLKKYCISDALNLISKMHPNKKYELHQYMPCEFTDIFIFKLKK